MWRLLRRRKMCAYVLTTTVILSLVIYTVNVNSSVDPGQFLHRPFHSFPLNKILNNGSGHYRNIITMFDPFSPNNGDRIGLKGLETFDCVQAIEGFPANERTTVKMTRLSDEVFPGKISDCPAFRERYGYTRYPPVSEEEAKFPIAFNILLYEEVDQLHLLLRAIYRPHNSYCLHVDDYSKLQVKETTRRLAACFPNVFLVSRPEKITYGGFTRLQADINCMQDHWNRSAKESRPWRYLINLPSQDFPLKTNLELVKILSIYNGANDIEGITGNRMLKTRFQFKHIYLPDGTSGRLKIVKTSKAHEAPPHNITVVKGSAYGVFSRGFVDYVLHARQAKDLLHWCRDVMSPDEYYWATLQHNPQLKVPGGYRGPPDEKPWLAVYASWSPRDLCVSKKITRGICIFGEGDLPQLVARKEMFANKFYMDFQPQTLHCLDQWIFNKTRLDLPFDTFYYRQLPFVPH